MPLTMANSGREVVVQKINAKEEIRRYLENLGFVEGAKVTVISEVSGNLIVNVKNARMAVSKAMGTRIMVCDSAEAC